MFYGIVMGTLRVLCSDDYHCMIPSFVFSLGTCVGLDIFIIRILLKNVLLDFQFEFRMCSLGQQVNNLDAHFVQFIMWKRLQSHWDKT